MKQETIYTKDRLHEADNVGITKINRSSMKQIIIDEPPNEYNHELLKQWMAKTFTHRIIYANNILKEDLLKNAKPKIKGEITKGKLRCRGIKLIHSPEGRYLTQRGERISRIV